jgi:hypothetical protein
MSKLPLCCFIAAVLAAGVAQATERKAYKVIDEKGNVTYSQTPPVEGKEAKKLDISPAHAGHGGPIQGSGDPSLRAQENADRRYSQQQQRQRAQNQRKDAQQKHVDALKAECNRQRGTDCNNPKTLRDMEAQNIPGGRRYPPR